MLLIQIKKRNDAPSVLTVIRPDGTTTYSKLQFSFEIHDIAHYVVEQQLGFRNAFYGLLSKGHDIGDFQLPKKERPQALHPKNLHHEALVTEHLVNLLTIDYLEKGTHTDSLKILASILEENTLAFPEQLTQERFLLMKQELRQLMEKWSHTVAGERLKLVFEP